MEEIFFIDTRERFPTLFSRLNQTDIGDMIRVHDSGELLSGDLAHNNPDYEKMKDKFKRRERLSFHILLAKYVEDPVLKNRIRTVYQRYQKKDPNDKEALC